MPPDTAATDTALPARTPRPLEGVRIIDVSTVIAGPLGTYLLASLGAEVIKVERPGTGDLARRIGTDPARNAALMGASFLGTNAGKRSITLDLKSPEGAAIFRRLVATADAVFENFRPGTMDKLGLGYAQLKDIRPGLVYCAVSGFGQDGPLAQRAAYDQIIQGMSGLMSLTGPEDGTPSRAGFVVSDSFAAAIAALGTVAALFRARQTGIGGMVDVSMLESTLVMAAWIVSDFVNAGTVPTRLGNDSRSSVPSGTFRTQDGHINIVCNEDHQFHALCDAVGQPGWKTDPQLADRQARFRRGAAVKALVNGALAGRTTAEWEAILARHGVPCGPILGIPEALALPQLRDRGFQRHCEGSDVKVGGIGLTMKGEVEPPPSPPPGLGQDTAVILGELGYDSDGLAALRRAKVI
ncbi:CaiB/BaiF CoA transferase family protein [Falsiroseomonas stagni]|uniref:Crotonobetainyl-CoA:carnitine CoA-transferase CaiB n=1 Tax=Falsiroseomonas stagni DSM 19981 TaxID=1123062 RepID=A0A1I4AFU2_9PROT|nr:CoA transferase [Falsiroseomonas stagni]SFK55214.1 Crotonobetainyl-CoA:carnitine CoA-transferase CaiB [Falsiroseomonas stagni DSM 19981]